MKTIKTFVLLAFIGCFVVLLLSQVGRICNGPQFSLSKNFKTQFPYVGATTQKSLNGRKEIMRRFFAVNFLEDDHRQDSTVIDKARELYNNNYQDSGCMLIENSLAQEYKINIEALLELGHMYKAADKLDDFKIICQNLMDKFPDDLEAFIAIAQFFSESGDGAYAVAVFEYGIALNPDNLSFHYSFGDLMEIEGNYQGALSQYSKALELNGNDPEGYFKIGEVYLKIGDTERADIYLGEASRISPDFLTLSQDLKSVWADM